MDVRPVGNPQEPGQLGDRLILLTNPCQNLRAGEAFGGPVRGILRLGTSSATLATAAGPFSLAQDRLRETNDEPQRGIGRLLLQLRLKGRQELLETRASPGSPRFPSRRLPS